MNSDITPMVVGKYSLKTKNYSLQNKMMNTYIKGKVIQTEKALTNDRLSASKVS